jgi:hypothetical protein
MIIYASQRQLMVCNIFEVIKYNYLLLIIGGTAFLSEPSDSGYLRKICCCTSAGSDNATEHYILALRFYIIIYVSSLNSGVELRVLQILHVFAIALTSRLISLRILHFTIYSRTIITLQINKFLKLIQRYLIDQ